MQSKLTVDYSVLSSGKETGRNPAKVCPLMQDRVL
jgi:hypothetical protein